VPVQMGSRGSDSSPLPGWAERIKNARQRANLTQRQLGERIHRSQQTVDGYESGGREPDVAVYRQIAAACSVDPSSPVHPSWLIFGDDIIRSAPSSDNSLTGIIAEAQEKSRHFAWTFYQSAKFLSEEGVDADLAYILAYTQKKLSLVDQEADDLKVRESILRAIEHDRQEFRRNIEEARKRLL
jgi:transcriptional regulator with XRE-family HTH domain